MLPVEYVGLMRTRLYVIVFFEQPVTESLIKFLGLPFLLMFITVFLPDVDTADGISLILTIILTNVALLFTLPPTDEFTTAEMVIIFQSVFTLIVFFLHQYLSLTTYDIILFDSAAVIAAMIHVFFEYRNFRSMVSGIKDKIEEASTEIMSTNSYGYQELDTYV
mmetsp:Transcript_4054/g.7461  ORF Transcript_4054/g.7461 Transcript_4054/m.7461 type:complete len:164 (+) Transcript_4054:1295-1786(+)